MKIVIQNGAYHHLSRKEAESVVSGLPAAWNSAVHKIVLARGNSLSTSFHPKERVLYLYSPSRQEAGMDKQQTLSTLLHGLARAVGDELPDALERDCLEALLSERPAQ